MKRITSWLLFVVLMASIAGCPFLNNQNRTFISADLSGGGLFGNTAADGPAEGEAEGDGSGGGERVVVEPDVIRREGNLLYILNQYRGLSIVDLDSETLLAQVPTFGTPEDLYFAEGVAYVLVGNTQTTVTENSTIGVASGSRIYAVDVATPAEATIQSNLDVAGSLVDSRLVGEVFYIVTANHGYSYGVVDTFAAEGTSATGQDNTTMVTSIDVSDPAAMVQADQASFSGTGHVVHVNSEAAFIATSDWSTNETTIVYLDISNANGTLEEVGTMSVRGNVADRFKLDAKDGVLRVVSSTWQQTNQVYVSTFDLNDGALAQLAEFRVAGAEGETLFATRFDGDRVYVVTFLLVDPLFVIDLSDPVNPVLLGALEVPGYSTHIEARGDRLIALGVDDTGGQSVSVSLFDVSGNGAPSLVDRVSFGENWSWSSAYNDVKAFTILDDVIIVPFSGWSGDSGGFDRLQFISYTADSLELRGNVDLSGTILRSFDYETSYYGVTTEQLSRIDAQDLDNPTVTSSIVLAENVVDYLAVSAELAVEIVARQDDDRLLVRAVNGTQVVQSTLVIDGGLYQNAWIYNETLVIAGVVWDDTSGYIVNVVDLSDPEALVVTETIRVPVIPYNAYYGYGLYDDVGIPESGVAEKDYIGYPYYYGKNEDIAFLLGDTLVLRCYGDTFDRVLGNGTAQQGLALVDLTTATWKQTLGLGYTNIVSLNARGDKLYLSTQESAIIQLFNPMTSYYVQELDVLNNVEGPSVNVPGAFVDYDPERDVLTLLDHQWGINDTHTTSLETLRWTGGASVEPLDDQALPPYSYNHVAADGHVYFESYDDRAALYQVVLGAEGTMSLSEPLVYGAPYGHLLNATGEHAFVSIGARAIAHYTFTDGVGVLTQLVDVMGYPSSVRIGNGMAHFPLGYYGLVTLPL